MLYLKRQFSRSNYCHLNQRSALSNSVFANAIPKYRVKEILMPDTRIFTYIIDEGTNFMDLYPAFRDAISMGFSNARIRTYIPTDPAEKELWNIKRLYGLSADEFFANNDYKLLPVDFPILDQLVILLKKNSTIKLEVAAHTDNTGLACNESGVIPKPGSEYCKLPGK